MRQGNEEKRREEKRREEKRNRDQGTLRVAVVVKTASQCYAS